MSDARTESSWSATTAPELATWLLARIAEDEQAAERLHTVSCSIHPQGLEETWCDCDYPARVLAECQAKRALIKAVEGDPFDALGAEAAYEQLVLQQLALPYADRDGYREEWKP